MDRTEVMVGENRAEIKELKERVEKNESDLDDRIVRVVCAIPGVGQAVGSMGLPPPASQAGKAPIARPHRNQPQADRHEYHFHEARRSLRVWPVPGPDIKAVSYTHLTLPTIYSV